MLTPDSALYRRHGTVSCRPRDGSRWAAPRATSPSSPRRPRPRPSRALRPGGGAPGRRAQGPRGPVHRGAAGAGHGRHGEVVVPLRLPLRPDLAGDRRGRHRRHLQLQHRAADQGGVRGAAGPRAGHGAAGRRLLEDPPGEEEEEEGGRLLQLRAVRPVRMRMGMGGGWGGRSGALVD
ncbi:hypothetical protein ANANG_G00028890 [Anguilla anguilla]|uniref:Uncharacterized protein n=1 Tax=Anguilla anguilla TaxID=7936 RepID=A0A9D3MVL5_ANGAN|nr:hypothetical protein ANANG_G00028890 [Anguilla anguilla]